MIQYQMVLSLVVAGSGVVLLVSGLAHLRSTVAATPAPPSSAAHTAGEHYYCLDCYDDFGERSAAVTHARERSGHDVTLLRKPTG